MSTIRVWGSVVFALGAALAGAQRAPAPLFSEVVLRDFQSWDRDGDGALSAAEVTREVLDPANHDVDAAAVAALHTYLAAAKQPPPLTRSFFAALRPARFTAPPDVTAAEKKRRRRAYDATPESLQSAFAGDLRRLRHKGEAGLYEEEGPRLSDIRQGQLGDCYFLAPLGAMVHRDPESIRRMIRADGAGYDVSFGDGKTVRVAPPTDAEVAMGGSATANGLWVRIMEKAYGSHGLGEGEAGIARDGMSGGSSGKAARSFTGHEFRRIGLVGDYRKPVSDVELEAMLAPVRRELPRALAERRLVLTGTLKKDPPPSITPNHAYAVFGYDPTTDVITIWNPHGNDFAPQGPEGLENGFRRVGGVFSMPLPLFARTFERITIEESAKG